MRTFNNEATLPHREKTEFFSKFQLEQLNYQADDPRLLFMTLQDFLDFFGNLYILLGVHEQHMHNLHSSYLEAEQFYESAEYEVIKSFKLFFLFLSR